MAAALRIGTRGSALALAQARAVAAAVEALGQPVELVTIETSGDRASRVRASRDSAKDRASNSAHDPSGGAPGGDKARFVKEIEAALLAGEVDLAVHSAKDVPGELPDGLAIVGVPERADARDALCLAPHIAAPAAPAAVDAPSPLGALPEGAVVGTASPRRRAQLLAARPDLDVRELRGNVDTRLGRLAEGNLDAALLAMAGLSRLGRAAAGVPLAAAAAVPAAGQGCIALEARAGDATTAAVAARLTDPSAASALAAERALVVALGADCHTPVGAHATVGADTVAIESFVGAPDGSTWIRDAVSAPAADPEAAGRVAAERLVAAGAEAILAAARA